MRNGHSTALCPAGVAAAAPHHWRIGCYDKWLVEFEREAIAAAILQLAIAAASYLTYDQRIVKSY